MTGTTVDTTELATKLVGAWDLVSFHDVDESGTTLGDPLGPAPCGTLLYTADGEVAVSMMPTTPGVVPSYLGYAGRWQVEGGQVVHRIAISSRADWVGITQSRDAELRQDDLLVRATREVDGKPQRRVLHWRRKNPG